ncbi:MAG: hypothetical protein KDK36_10570 [Leptospiraceae bacterium]|nr:hypothetical protein [Leptospiraceae bacterium]
MENSRQITFIGQPEKNYENGFQPATYYVLEEKSIYSGYPYRIGDLNLYFPDKIPALEGSVLIEGKIQKDLTSHIKFIKKAEEDEYGSKEHRFMQIRSDWLPVENRRKDFRFTSWVPGITSKEILSNLSYIHVEKWEEIKVIEIDTHEKDKILVQIKNPLKVSFPELTLTSHYEGGKGKPSPHYETEKIPVLTYKKTKFISIPRIIKAEKFGKDYRLETIKLSGEKDNLIIDLELYVR